MYMKVFAQMDSDLQMNGAEAVIKALVENGVEVILDTLAGLCCHCMMHYLKI